MVRIKLKPNAKICKSHKVIFYLKWNIENIPNELSEKI